LRIKNECVRHGLHGLTLSKLATDTQTFLPADSAEGEGIRAKQLEKKGMPIGPYDLFIAGLARSRDMILVTNNTKEFERIVDLHLENWVE